MLTAETKIQVRYPDVDPMGIVHHAVYPVWYEIARMDYFAKLGFPYEEMHSHGINPPLVDLHLQFKATVSYPGTVTVKTRCLAFGSKKLKLGYEIYDGEGKLVNTCESFHIWTGPDNRSLAMDQALPQVYSLIRAAAGEDRETL